MLPYIFTVPTIYFVNIYLKLEIPIDVQHYFDSSNVRGEGNSVVCINREIFLGPEDARICFTLLTTTRDCSDIQRRVLLITIFFEILFFILILLKIKSTMCGIGALNTKKCPSLWFVFNPISFTFLSL